MKLIETKTLTSDTAAIEFTSIPQDGTDLLVLATLRVSFDFSLATWWLAAITFNSNTSSYSTRNLSGSGSGAGSDTDTTFYFRPNDAGSTSNTFGNASAYITNYAGNTNKSVSIDNVSEENGTVAQQQLVAGLWSNTAAITSLKIEANGSNLVAGTTVSLYKITKGSGGASVS
jgi:hypothetical protein